jgi:hypothetical protein
MFEEAAFVDLLLSSAESNRVTLYPAVSEAVAERVPIGLRQVSRRTAGFAHNSKRRDKWIGWDQRCSFMCGRTACAKYSVLMKFRSTADRQSSMDVAANFFAGGPPALVTQMSTRPNLRTTASTN